MAGAPVIQPSGGAGGASLAPDAGNAGAGATINPTEARVQQQAAAAVAAQQAAAAVAAYAKRERDVREYTDALADYHGLPDEFRSTEAPEMTMVNRRGSEISSLRSPKGADLAANARDAETQRFADWERDQLFEGDKLHRARDYLYYQRERANAGVTSYFSGERTGNYERDLVDVQQAYNAARNEGRDFVWEGKIADADDLAFAYSLGMINLGANESTKEAMYNTYANDPLKIGRAGVLADPNSAESKELLEKEYQEYLKFRDTPLTFENKVYMPRVAPERIAMDAAKNAARVEYNAAQSEYVANLHNFMVNTGYKSFEDLGRDIAEFKIHQASQPTFTDQVRAAEKAAWTAYQNRSAAEQTNPTLRDYAKAIEGAANQNTYLFMSPGQNGSVDLNAPMYLSGVNGYRQLTPAEQKDVVGSIRISLPDPVTGRDIEFRVSGTANKGDKLESLQYNTHIPLLGEPVREEAYRTDTLQFPVSVPGYEQPLWLSPTEPISEKQAESILENLGIAHRDPVSREIVQNPEISGLDWSKGIASAATDLGDAIRDSVSKPLESAFTGAANLYDAWADKFIDLYNNRIFKNLPGADLRQDMVSISKANTRAFFDFESGLSAAPENVVRDVGSAATLAETVVKNPDLITPGNVVYAGTSALEAIAEESKKNPARFFGEIVGETLITLPLGTATASTLKAAPGWIGRRIGLHDVGVESPVTAGSISDLGALSEVIEGGPTGSYIRRVPAAKSPSEGFFVRDFTLEAKNPEEYGEPGKREILFATPDHGYAPSWAELGKLGGFSLLKNNSVRVFRLQADKVPISPDEATTVYREVANSPVYGKFYDTLEERGAAIAAAENKPVVVASYNKQFGHKLDEKEAEVVIIPAGGASTQKVRAYFAGLSRDGRPIWNMTNAQTNTAIAKEFLSAWGERILKNNQFYVDWKAPFRRSGDRVFVPKTLLDYYGEQAALKQIQQETRILPTTYDFSYHGPAHTGSVARTALDLIEKYPEVYGKNIDKTALEYAAQAHDLGKIVLNDYFQTIPHGQAKALSLLKGTDDPLKALEKRPALKQVLLQDYPDAYKRLVADRKQWAAFSPKQQKQIADAIARHTGLDRSDPLSRTIPPSGMAKALADADKLDFTRFGDKVILDKLFARNAILKAESPMEKHSVLTDMGGWDEPLYIRTTIIPFGTVAVVAPPTGNPQSLNVLKKIKKTSPPRRSSLEESRYLRDLNLDNPKYRYGYKSLAPDKGYYPVILPGDYDNYPVPAKKTYLYPAQLRETSYYPAQYPTDTEYAAAYTPQYSPGTTTPAIYPGGYTPDHRVNPYPTAPAPRGGYPVAVPRTIPKTTPIIPRRKKSDTTRKRKTAYRKIRVENLEHLSITDPLEALGIGSMTNRTRRKPQPKTTYYEYDGIFSTTLPRRKSGDILPAIEPQRKPGKRTKPKRRKR